MPLVTMESKAPQGLKVSLAFKVPQDLQVMMVYQESKAPLEPMVLLAP